MLIPVAASGPGCGLVTRCSTSKLIRLSAGDSERRRDLDPGRQVAHVPAAQIFEHCDSGDQVGAQATGRVVQPLGGLWAPWPTIAARSWTRAVWGDIFRNHQSEIVDLFGDLLRTAA